MSESFEFVESAKYGAVFSILLAIVGWLLGAFASAGQFQQYLPQPVNLIYSAGILGIVGAAIAFSLVWSVWGWIWSIITSALKLDSLLSKYPNAALWSVPASLTVLAALGANVGMTVLVGMLVMLYVLVWLTSYTYGMLKYDVPSAW